MNGERNTRYSIGIKFYIWKDEEKKTSVNAAIQFQTEVAPETVRYE